MAARRVLLQLLLLPLLLAQAAQAGEERQEQGRAEPTLQVHLVPHAHSDVGWRKTFGQYATGQNVSLEHANTHAILDSVLDALEHDEARTFVWVESAFLSRYLADEDFEGHGARARMRLRRLVQNGQLSFANGDWSMHDEAATHVVGMVDSMAYGHAFLKETLGVLPRIGWQIDPFGHSATHAALLAAKEYDALYFGRIDFEDKRLRSENGELQFVWSASPSLGDAGRVFAGVSYDGNYEPPTGFCWDPIFCSGALSPPIQDDKRFDGYNVDERVNDFVNAVQKEADSTRGSHIMIKMGADFFYQESLSMYANMDKLIRHVNKDGRVHVFYSSPERYTDAVHAQNIAWPLKTDDFFPYANDPNSYWTGYFTSRPTLKFFERRASGILQVARQTQFLTNLINEHGDGAMQLSRMKHALGLLQHHDAVSGTSKQHVAYDYFKLGSEGYADCETVIDQSLRRLAFNTMDTSTDTVAPETDVRAGALREMIETPQFLQQCRDLNESVCAASTSNDASANGFYVVVYNPLPRPRSEYLRIPITAPFARVVTSGNDGDEATVVHQVVETEPSPARDSTSVGPYTLVFQASDVPALGVRRYNVHLMSSEAPTATDGGSHSQNLDRARLRASAGESTVVIENDVLSVSFSTQTGRMVGMANKQDGVSIALDQSLAYYNSFQTFGQNSGAYIFRPADEDEVPTPIGAGADDAVTCTASRQSMRQQIDSSAPSCGEATITKVVRGPVVSEVWQEFDSWATQIVRLYEGEDHVEVQWTVGPVPIDDNQGKEVVTVFNTDIANEATFYTDSNSREFQQRVRDYRPTWDLHVTQPVAGNYYPVNAAMYMKDSTRQFTVLTDRSQGGGSIEDGTLELMVHRRILRDDLRGVSEPLNETTDGISHSDWTRMGGGITVRGKHYLHLSKPQSALRAVRPLMDRLFAPINTAFGGSAARAAGTVTRPAPSGLLSALPVNVQLMTLEQQPGSPHELLVRLSHQFGVDEDTQQLSQPVTVDLCRLFRDVRISDVTEMTLSANQPLKNLRKLQWIDDGDTTDASEAQQQPGSRGVTDDEPGACTVSISAMDIRTFLLAFSRVQL